MKNIDNSLKCEINLVNQYIDDILYSENSGMKEIIEGVIKHGKTFLLP